MRELPIEAAMKRRVAFAVAFASAALPLAFVLVVTAVRSTALGTGFHAALMDVSRDLVSLALCQALGFALVLYAALHREAPPSYREALFVRPISKTAVLVALLGGLAMHLLVTEAANVIETFVPRTIETKLRLAALLSPKTVVDGLALVLAVIVVAPVAEELVFRGLLLPRLALRVGTLEALVLSSMLFGASHAMGGPHVVIPATLAGLALAYVSRAQRSVIASIVMHAGSNALPLLLTPRLVRVPGLNVVREGPSHVAPELVLGATVVVMAALMYLSRDLPVDPDDRG